MRAACVALLVGCALAGCGGEPARDDQATPVSLEEALRCLGDEQPSFDVQGPLAREPQDTDAPDETLIVAGGRASAYLGYYDDEARAERSAREQIEHAKQFDGVVERHGGLTIVWVRGPDTDDASEIKSCALS